MRGRTRTVISSASQQTVDANNYLHLPAKPPIGCHLHTKLLHHALSRATVNVFGTCRCDSPPTMSRIATATQGKRRAEHDSCFSLIEH
eukprot:scaffold33036_cov35-Prasinocladus_malaysianus.AAC.2